MNWYNALLRLANGGFVASELARIFLILSLLAISGVVSAQATRESADLGVSGKVLTELANQLAASRGDLEQSKKAFVDNVKNLPEYKTARARLDAAFEELDQAQR